MRQPRNRVVTRKVTRYFVFGKGYNSNVVAHMQIAKAHVRNLELQAWRAAGKSRDFEAFAKAWYEARYPARENCNCAYCSAVRRGFSSAQRGCWIAKLADYRQIAKEIIDGRRAPNGDEIKALPTMAGVGR